MTAINNITVEQIKSLFSLVKQGFDQSRVADRISNFNGSPVMKSITCAHIAAAAQGCDESYRRDVIDKLCSTTLVTDKENSGMVAAQLSAFQFMMVEQYFH